MDQFRVLAGDGGDDQTCGRLLDLDGYALGLVIVDVVVRPAAAQRHLLITDPRVTSDPGVGRLAEQARDGRSASLDS